MFEKSWGGGWGCGSEQAAFNYSTNGFLTWYKVHNSAWIVYLGSLCTTTTFSIDITPFSIKRFTILPPKVKMQYLQIYYIVDTSISCQISHQSAFILKGCMYIWNNLVDTAFSYGRGLIIILLNTSGISQEKRKCSACDLKSRYCVFTLWGRGTFKDGYYFRWRDGLFHYKRRQWVPNRLKNKNLFFMIMNPLPLSSLDGM